MAMSARERKQAQREAERIEMSRLPDSTYDYLRQPFHQWINDDPNFSSVELPLELAGFEPPVFDDDEGPASYANETALDPDLSPEETFPGYSGSIGRAEVMVDCLLDAALELAQIINRYKLDELSARRREIERSDLPDAATRKLAFDEMARIAKIEAELSKNIRRTIPQWKVKGV
ncbi:hypothetical protein LVO79_15500 [Roseivivax marinus]|uniref:hypothetical protein n=1 Tax=Roseivivax marinus TaxID=1379903 RepID=UPI001F04E291|nr:hypothetical protein [Roseivivax marinus]UMA64398.1 hypothetical protein LVO79_15500 [Roseivivax marinus]